MIDRKKQIKADMLLVLVTLCWGTSYFMMDLCLEEMDPLTLNSYRFLGAFVVAALISFKRIRNVNKITLKYSFYISITLVLIYILATYGVRYTTQSNAGFFCATATIFTPIFVFIINRTAPGKKLAVVVVLCTIGIALMSLDSDMHMASGDILCLLCGMSYSFDLIVTERAVRHEKVNAYQIGVYQLGFTGVWMTILAFILEEPCLPQTPACWGSVAFLAIFCTGVAFIAQSIAQQYTTASHVGVIYALEPVFAGIVAFLFAGERLLPRAYFGAFLLLIGILMMELDLKAIFKSKSTTESESKTKSTSKQKP